MKKILKWIIRIFLSLLVLVVIAAIVLPIIIDPNDYKDTIEEKIHANIGRTVHLGGEIQWSVFPWLALTFNDVTMENDKAFKQENLAEIKTLSARVKLLPLLKKDIKIGRISIEDASFNLQVAKNGHSNWQSILDKLNSGSEKDDSGSNDTSSQSLDIAGINLSNISLNYDDAQSQTRANISQMTLSTGEIKSGKEVNIDAALNVKMPDQEMEFDIKSQLLVKNLLSNKGMLLLVSSFKMQGHMGNNVPLNIELEDSGELDLSKDTLSLSKITIALGDANIVTNVTGSKISGASVYSGAYKIDKFDLNKLLTLLTGAAIVSSDALSDFSSSGQWTLSGKRLKVDKLIFAFDKTNVNGQADIKNLDNLTGDFNLNIDQLNLDKLIPSDEATTTDESVTSTTTNQSTAMEFGHLKGSIKIGSLQASGAKMENITLQLISNGSQLTLQPLKADFYQGLLNTQVKIDTKAANNKLIVEHKMNKIQAGPLLTDVSGSQLLTGLSDLNIDINIDEPFSDIPLKTAHGTVNFNLSDGAIYGVDVFGMIQKGLSLLYPEVKNEEPTEEKKTTFALMQVVANIDAGILKTQTLKIDSPYLKITGDVTIDLVNSTIKGTIEPMLLDVPEQLTSDKYKKLLNIPIPVSLSGSLLEPDIKIDVQKLILATQKQKIDKEKDKLKKKLLDGLFGG